MDRCNLSVLLLPSQADLAGFGRSSVRSSPRSYYKAPQTDAQRGEGVFDKSMEGLRRLNQLGYGNPDSGWSGSCPQSRRRIFAAQTRRDRIAVPQRTPRQTRRRVQPSHHYEHADQPFSRFLVESENYEAYMARLPCSNPAAAAGDVPYTLSVGWNGTLYDCDFSNARTRGPWRAARIRDFNPARLQQRVIVTGNHCWLRPAQVSCGNYYPSAHLRGSACCSLSGLLWCRAFTH